MNLDNIGSAVVTGGASGLGAATARALARHGVKVALFDLDKDKGNAVADEIGGLYCNVDVTSEESVDAGLASARGQHGQERVLVNCAGIVTGSRTAGRSRQTDDTWAHDLAAFTKVVAINLIGSFHMSAKCAAGMMGLDPVSPDCGRGVLVSTSSIAAVDGQIGQAAYAASKGGVASLTLPMARDLAREGIRVMSVMPGLFHTPMFDGLAEEVQQALGAGVPFPPRLGNPNEFASLVLHIIDNDMLNGENIRLDGALRLAPK